MSLQIGDDDDDVSPKRPTLGVSSERLLRLGAL